MTFPTPAPGRVPRARDSVEGLPGSRIREVANAALGRDDVLPFWFGESDEPTPAPVREAAAASLAAGETFYSHNLGLPALREAIAAYMAGLHPAVGAERIAVTSGGVNALMVAMQALVDPGDEVVAVVPLWPNLTAQAQILGARVRRFALRSDSDRPQDGWRLDLDGLLAAITPATRVLLLNAPNNPTGWTLDAQQQAALLAHCRATGTWIVADEVYERVYFGPGRAVGAPVAAPSFLDLGAPDDRLVVVHSFSKSFLMTGWRLGWMVLPPALVPAVGKLLEFNTSCAPVFVQRAGIAALGLGEALVAEVTGRLRLCRDTLLPLLAATPRVQVATPAGGMYAFFRVDGEADSLALAKRLVAEAGLGLAPGVAFGDEGEGWLRWCFASRDPARLEEGVRRLRAGLGL
ncbi:pyridoxal phosphate-dependent aminotransferase [Piscinibacter sakaiensis]|uniref:Aminotransferase n=1 Tax=Piscinibacter sakaiensis TaxID=1547922 RepID=A0A0K8NYW1_PISS1|nr:pyridoxal phosphate-dependent aminotransferase [Piscinibacter sakaiensis]GAP35568.1 aspartate aminotransferase [Piscinibacter sakaiensis]